MQLGTLEQQAAPEKKPARRCSVPGCDAGDADICKAFERLVCYRHLATFDAQHPWDGRAYETDKALFATWLAKQNREAA